MNILNEQEQYVFGGYNKSDEVRYNSTSGGAFSAIIDTYCDENYVIFGAEANGINVFHSYITDKKDLDKYRKSKYSQSKMGNCYKDVDYFLSQGCKVVFSGTPCQVAGLKMFLQNSDTTNLLTIEVVCEGVPSNLYIKKYEEAVFQKYKKEIEFLDYRYKGKTCFNHSKWDFEIMRTKFAESRKELLVDRWFNPFWSIWIQHLMSRPACYECPFARKERAADVSLGDLWGVHLYCPELYGNNGGASLVFANSEKGKKAVLNAQNKMNGHELKLEDALKYQGPMRKHIDVNPKREEFIRDLQSNMSLKKINKKWAKKPTIKLLWQKYIWGNRQKVWLWKLTNGKYKIK